MGDEVEKQRGNHAHSPSILERANLQKLAEQMPRVEAEFKLADLPQELSVRERAAYLWGLQVSALAQREADAKGMLEQGLVRLPSEEELLEKLYEITGVDAKRRVDFDIEELLRWLAEGKEK